MKILLVDNGTKHLAELQSLIPDAEVTQKWSTLTSDDVHDYDLIVLSGSSTSSVLWNQEDFQEEINLIRNTQTPLIGICFGCELIAFAYGGTLRELPEPHVGIREIAILDPEFSPKPTLTVYEHHRWIIESLPEEFIVLATSEDGPEAFKHKERPIYGLQFHPEHCVPHTDANQLFTRLYESLAHKNQPEM